MAIVGLCISFFEIYTNTNQHAKYGKTDETNKSFEVLFCIRWGLKNVFMFNNITKKQTFPHSNFLARTRTA